MRGCVVCVGCVVLVRIDEKEYTDEVRGLRPFSNISSADTTWVRVWPPAPLWFFATRCSQHLFLSSDTCFSLESRADLSPFEKGESEWTCEIHLLSNQGNACGLLHEGFGHCDVPEVP